MTWILFGTIALLSAIFSVAWQSYYTGFREGSAKAEKNTTCAHGLAILAFDEFVKDHQEFELGQLHSMEVIRKDSGNFIVVLRARIKSHPYRSHIDLEIDRKTN